MNQMDPELQGFFKRLINQAINAAINSIFWKMPLVWSVVILLGLIATVVYFKLY